MTMSARDDLPAHVADAPEARQRAWIEAYDSAVHQDGDDERARRIADEAMASVADPGAET